MPLKLAVTGSKFSGKKSIASKLIEEFSLTKFDVNELIKEMEAIMNPPEEEEDPKKKKKDEEEVNEEELKEMQAIGEKIKTWRDANSESGISEALMAEILAHKIKHAFSFKNKEEVEEALKEQIGKEDEINTQI
jgi:broad-specificity NMP kinase